LPKDSGFGMIEMMKAVTADFPFVAELPKREKSKLVKLWDEVKALAEASKEHGALLPVGIVVGLLGVCRQRVYDLIEEGKLQSFKVHGHVMVSEKSIEEWCRTERKAGRPCNLPSTMAESWKRSKNLPKENPLQE